jgi:hypothetical protein
VQRWAILLVLAGNCPVPGRWHPLMRLVDRTGVFLGEVRAVVATVAAVLAVLVAAVAVVLLLVT